jgi:hypothetical protein
MVSEILAKQMKSFGDGDVTEECLEAVAYVAFHK